MAELSWSPGCSTEVSPWVTTWALPVLSAGGSARGQSDSISTFTWFLHLLDFYSDLISIVPWFPNWLDFYSDLISIVTWFPKWLNFHSDSISKIPWFPVTWFPQCLDFQWLDFHCALISKLTRFPKWLNFHSDSISKVPWFPRCSHRNHPLPAYSEGSVTAMLLKPFSRES